jgi:hypothetical protein
MVLFERDSEPASVAKSPSERAVLNCAVVPVTVLLPRAMLLFERVSTLVVVMNPVTRFAWVIFLVVPAEESVVSETSTIATKSPEATDVRAVRSDIFLLAMVQVVCVLREKQCAIFRQEIPTIY